MTGGREAGLSQYLSPEPLLQRPNYLQSAASQGESVATYAYAANNPIGATDPTGLYKLSGTCPNYKAALALAQKLAGCGAGAGGGTDMTCSCQKAISKVTGGCDVCPFLVDGAGPDLLPKLAWYEDRAHTNAGDPNVYKYKNYHMEDNSVAVGSRFCTEPFLGSNVRDLAMLLVHEATHFCATVNGGVPTLDPETKNAADACFK